VPGEPFHGLSGDALDRVEVAVVMEDGRSARFRDRCNQKVHRPRAAVLALRCEERLHALCCSGRSFVERKAWKVGEQAVECVVVALAAR